MATFTKKTITCKHCPPGAALAIVLSTKVDDEGFASHSGWAILRDHVNRAHPEFAAKPDAWIYGETAHKMPFEVIEREVKKAERVCGTAEAA